jgi:hypothetical protein
MAVRNGIVKRDGKANLGAIHGPPEAPVCDSEAYRTISLRRRVACRCQIAFPQYLYGFCHRIANRKMLAKRLPESFSWGQSVLFLIYCL